jgi:hypothetical protein
VTNVAGQAREQATHQLDVRKERAVDAIGVVADAIRGTSDKLRDAGPVGMVAERAADGIEQVASFFEGKQVKDLVRDVERFARREPAIFLGAAFAIGLIGGRFLKSSPPRNEARASAVGPYGSEERYGMSSPLPYDSSRREEPRFQQERYSPSPAVTVSPIVNASPTTSRRT